ncbi:FtsX-like permease family protein [Rheinheimera sediminis]|uniref:ABC transporter permease n=1 Tax=Rheinheimera sp. YQF-1 TaxID=2499626 RepID=UPI000FDCD60A|nr:ABC transporter permease [Rheinheimera sp. YQF-1]RVT42769.1 FtsX-like permease family protein [Rheinheimera sp. YQF-1]
MQLYYWFRSSAASVLRDKSFLTTVTATMGIASGVFLLVLTYAYVLLIKPLPYPQAEQLQVLQYQRLDASAVLQSSAVLHPAAEKLYKQLRQWQQPEQKIAETATFQQALLHLTLETVMSDPRQPRLSTGYITPELPQMLGMPLLLGQDFSEAQLPGAMNPGVIISYRAWQLLFEQRPDVLSQKLSINGVSHPVLGVVAAAFVPPRLHSGLPTVDLWLPWDYNNSDFKGSWHLADDHSALLLKGESATLDLQLAALTPLAQHEFAEQLAGEKNFAGWQVQLQLQSLKSALTANSGNLIFLLIVAAAALLLIATTNILNLFLSRLMLLQKQLAIRAALGARRRQLWQQLFAEALFVMLLSVMLGLILASGCFHALLHWFGSEIPRSSELRITAFSMGCAVLVAIVLAFIIASLSVRTVRYQQLSRALQSNGKGAGVQIPKVFRQSFILLQISSAILLVFLSSLLVQDAIQKLQRPLGFNADPLLQVEFSVTTLDWKGWNSYAPKVAEMAEHLRQQPGVEEVSFTYSPLVDRFQMSATEIGSGRRFYPFHRNVDQYYFNLTEQALLSGQGFVADDIKAGHSPKMIVNRTFARKLIGDSAQTDDFQQVLGKRIQLDIEQTPFSIVGVTEDIQLPGYEMTPPRFYITNLGTALWLLIKLEPGATFSKENMIKMLQQTDSQFALTDFSQLKDEVAKLYFPQKIILLGAISLAVFTVFLSCIGLIGVMHYNLQLRQTEFSIKLALGAEYRHIVLESGRDYRKVLLSSLLLASLLIVVCDTLFSSWLAGVLNSGDTARQATIVQWQTLPLYLLTLLLVMGCGVFAHGLPLHRLNQHSISQNLRGQ